MPVPLPLHLGGLHPFEQLLVLAIAFGPFVVLCVVVWFRRRQDLADERAAAAVDPDPPLDKE
ncbi:hypothetical protein EKO23_18185 [Nocardioides guangzhouensis]|uniref:Uncharacterized protein n=1 Tax=Nocardioides guangzhouensis TaxID=2497878 RepID=A0A4Q4Z952_9ACTN|nr:hypothetical protein [Nocardioides guangzhouensis]RYP83686.1 hypothetical protein EKO23_18185 [Nocardioides guangzhouensis]